MTERNKMNKLKNLISSFISIVQKAPSLPLCLVFYSVVASSLSQADYSALGKRYLSAEDLELSVRRLFQVPYSCTWSPFELSALGRNIVSMGRPITPMPSAEAIQALRSCYQYFWGFKYGQISIVDAAGPTAKNILGLIASTQSWDQLRRFISPVELKAFQSEKSEKLSDLRFDQLLPDVQKKIVQEMVEHVMGTDLVILDHGIVKNMHQFREEIRWAMIQKKQPISETLYEFVWQLFIRDESLSS